MMTSEEGRNHYHHCLYKHRTGQQEQMDLKSSTTTTTSTTNCYYSLEVKKQNNKNENETKVFLKDDDQQQFRTGLLSLSSLPSSDELSSSKNSFTMAILMNIVIMTTFLLYLWTTDQLEGVRVKDYSSNWTTVKEDMLHIPLLLLGRCPNHNKRVINFFGRNQETKKCPIISLIEKDSKTIRHNDDNNSSSSNNNSSSTTKKAVITTQRPVVQSRPSFPSFLDYHNYPGSNNNKHNDDDENHNHPPPILNVSYDSRSLLFNGERILLLGGSIHPGWRVTQLGWEHALDEAVRQGLNLVTMYIFWNSHQPYPDDSELNWNYPTSSISKISNIYHHHHTNTTKDDHDDDDDDNEWSLASAIRSAGKRGLFVHLRIGPYICGEYNNGGIPEWLPIQYPNISIRHYQDDWRNVMTNFVNSTVSYIRNNSLWSYQGGNIILAQIENEILSDQKYANWCGSIANQLEPNIIWTMCNGLSSSNNDTILTCNGPEGKCIKWLERHGDTGRIQIDQPALLTEFQGGFQTWGETSQHPSIYFWGVTARSKARYALQWFARGGSHLNYYMWLGGYNRGRSNGGGITNMYANDVSLCSSGVERHEPKFSHYQDLHEVVANIADILLESSTSQLHKQHTVQVWNETTSMWQVGDNQRMFIYSSLSSSSSGSELHNHQPSSSRHNDSRVIVFLENDAESDVLVRIPSSTTTTVLGETMRILNHNDNGNSSSMMKKTQDIKMSGLSVILLVDGIPRFDSASIDSKHMQYKRRMIVEPENTTLHWSSYPEPIGAPSSTTTDPRRPVRDTAPIEHTLLHVTERTMFSDYTWYETEFVLDTASNQCTLSIVTRREMALSAFVNGILIGSALDHSTGHERNLTLIIDYTGPLPAGKHTLSILSESLGFVSNPQASTEGKKKGITGDVILQTFHGMTTTTTTTIVNGKEEQTNRVLFNTTQNLVDGREWRSYPSLHGEAKDEEFWSMKLSKDDEVVQKTLRNHQQRSLLEERRDDPTRSSLSGSCPTWSFASFCTPDYDPTKQALYLEITTGRGKLWLNGNDLGRFWNITRGDTERYSQQYYFLPKDFLYDHHDNDDDDDDCRKNEIVRFDSVGGSSMILNNNPRLVLSWIEVSNSSTLLDEVDFPSACLT